MDPVTITATVVTFATAAKDLVELGQKIHESFAMVSKNRRSAQRAADNIKDMINDINTIYKNHQDALANMEEFDIALKELLEKFRGFQATILPLVPQTRGSWISLSFLRGWWNNNKIKDSILALEADVREVKQRYMMKTAMRTEVKQEINHHDTTRRLEGLSQGLEVLRTDVRAIRVSTTVAYMAPTALGTTDERERNVVLFVRSAMSTSASLLRPPDDVTEEVMMTVFIKSQIACIEADVAKISTLRIFNQGDPEPFSVYILTDTSMEILSLRRKVVRKLMDLRDDLSDFEYLQAISVDRAAIKLNDLSLQLSALGLGEESRLFRDWTIRLARALVSAPGLRGEVQHRASLAFYLYCLSRECAEITQRRQAIEESLSITETLPSQDSTDTEFQGLRAAILIDYARCTLDNESAISRCLQAVQLLEGIFGVEVLTSVDLHGIIGDVIWMAPNYDLVDHVFSSSPQDSIISSCADALREIAVYMLRAGMPLSAKHLAHICIALRRKTVSFYGDGYRELLVFTLTSICQGELAQCFTAIELLDMVDECALLFRELTQNNPVYYSEELLHILWRRADILQQLNRNSDSVSTREEVVTLMGQLVLDSGLQADALLRLAEGFYHANRYLDAVRAISRIPPMARAANGDCAQLCVKLSKRFLVMRQYEDAAEAATSAVAIYRGLGAQHINLEWTHGLVNALCALARSQIALGNHSIGLVALKDSVAVAGNGLNASLDVIPTKFDLERHLYSFRLHVMVAFLVHEAPHAISTSSLAIEEVERLSTRHPQIRQIFRALARAQVYHAYGLYNLGHLEDSLRYITQRHNALSATGTGSDFAGALREMTWIKAKTLATQGYLEQALAELRNLRSVPLLWIIHGGAQLQVLFGNADDALDLAEQALDDAESSPVPSHRMSILSLFGVAYASLHCRNYQRTMESAGRGIELSTDPKWQSTEREEEASFRPSLFAMMSSAVANTGDLDRALNYAQQAVVLSLDLAELKHAISSLTAKHSLMETRGYLAEVLLATGDLTQARQICDERRAYFTERVTSRIGEYRDLAPILRMLGVLCCHEGRHDEGEAAARELTDIINRLGLVFPSLQEQVKIRLRYQASVPILQILDEMTEKLDCEHQKGITALFKD